MRAVEIFEKVYVDNYSRWQNPSANATMCVAAHNKTGLPLVIFKSTDRYGVQEACHVGVYLPTGKWFDSDGLHRASDAIAPIQCDPECTGLGIEMVPATEAEVNEAFRVQYSGMWEADVYMKFFEEIKNVIIEYGGKFD